MFSISPFYAEYVPWIWLGLAVIFAVIEGVTLALTTIWFSISAGVMVFVAMTPLSLRWQLYIFAGLSLFLFVFTRPFAVKWLKVKKENTNADSLIGKKIRLTKPVTEQEKGETKINGVVWSVASEDNTPIPQDSHCIVEKIAGVTLIVRSADPKISEN